jgi:hypothetical protein
MNRKNPWIARYIAVLFGVAVLGVAPVVFNFVVDPFNMNGWFDLDLDKREISVKAHYPLYKMIEYPRKRAPRIILGDSRSRALQDRFFEEKGLDGVYNFAYGGATIPEIYSTYKYLRENTKLDALVIGVPLRTFDIEHRGGLNRVPDAIEIADAPLRYYSSWFVARTGWANVEDRYGATLDKLARLMPSLIETADAADLRRVPNWTLDHLLDPELCAGCKLPESRGTSELPGALKRYGLGLGVWADVWQERSIERPLPKKYARQVSKNAANDWRKFSFSEELWSKIEEIAEWCDREGIQLLFFVPPTIVEMQHRIADFGLADVNHAYRARLAELAPVIDFDFDNPVTRELAHFKDAYHFDSNIARAIVAELAQLMSSSERRPELQGEDQTLIKCPIEEDQHRKHHTHNGLTMSEGVNCRIWRKSDV